MIAWLPACEADRSDALAAAEPRLAVSTPTRDSSAPAELPTLTLEWYAPLGKQPCSSWDDSDPDESTWIETNAVGAAADGGAWMAGTRVIGAREEGVLARVGADGSAGATIAVPQVQELAAVAEDADGNVYAAGGPGDRSLFVFDPEGAPLPGASFGPVGELDAAQVGSLGETFLWPLEDGTILAGPESGANPAAVSRIDRDGGVRWSVGLSPEVRISFVAVGAPGELVLVGSRMDQGAVWWRTVDLSTGAFGEESAVGTEAFGGTGYPRAVRIDGEAVDLVAWTPNTIELHRIRWETPDAEPEVEAIDGVGPFVAVPSADGFTIVREIRGTPSSACTLADACGAPWAVPVPLADPWIVQLSRAPDEAVVAVGYGDDADGAWWRDFALRFRLPP